MIGESGFENLVWFMGLVEDINDPRTGRVKVRCFGFHPTVGENTVAKEDLPWAHIVRSNSKIMSMPDEGDVVMGCFMDGRDAQHPIVFGVINTDKFSLPSIGGTQLPPYETGQEGPINLNTSSLGEGWSTNGEKAYRYFIDNGFTPAQAAGLVGNLQAESGKDLNPAAFNPDDKGKPAYGIAQWRDTRADDFKAKYGVYPNEATLDQQLEFMMYEFNGKEKNAYAKIKEAPSAAAAAAAVDKYYERSDGKAISDRIGNANKLFDIFTGDSNFPVNSDGTRANQHPYMPVSQSAYNNYGNPAMPYQFHGEGIERSPLLTQAALKKVARVGNFVVEEPLRPVAANIHTSVWQASYYGSSIELAGNTDENEFISITHATGSHITLDSHGNISIKSFGGTHNSTEGSMGELVTGAKIAEYGTGYEISVKGGKCVIQAAGDIEFQAGGDFSITAGGKLAINVGDSIDIAGSRIAATARVDAIDLIATGKMALQSKAVGLSIDSTEAVFVQSGKGISFKSTEDFILQSGTNFSVKAADNIAVQAVGGTLGLKSQGSATIASSVNVGLGADGNILVKGSEIHLNSPGLNPASVSDADDAGEVLATITANVPEAIARGVSSDTIYEPIIPQINPLTPDNPQESTASGIMA